MNSSKALDLFIERLPKKPYCTDDLDWGLITRNRATALGMRYLQYDPPAFCQALVFDIDRAGALQAHTFASVARPNFAVENPANGHAHLVYVLATPIIKTAAARKKVLRYGALIETCYRDALNADRGYSGLITKNPIHSTWQTITLEPEPYTLAELAEWINLGACNDHFRSAGIRDEYAGLGRNCFLFEQLRTWAYHEIREHWKPAGDETFSTAVLAEAERINASFPSQLPYSEVRSNARSVAKWTWGLFTPSEFRAIQAARSLRAADKRKRLADERAAEARALKQLGHSDGRIAEILGVHRSTCYRLLHCR